MLGQLVSYTAEPVHVDPDAGGRMSQLTLQSAAAPQLGGAAELAGFILVLARVTPLFVLAPLFSSKMIPPRVRGIIAVGALDRPDADRAARPARPERPARRSPALVLEGCSSASRFAFALVGAAGRGRDRPGSLLDIARRASPSAATDQPDQRQPGRRVSRASTRSSGPRSSSRSAATRGCCAGSRARSSSCR